MNERIKELYDQASIRYSVYEILKPRDERKSIPDIFAELIVKECASVCHTHGWGMLEHGMSGHNIADDCGTLIKEHFGVEE